MGLTFSQSFWICAVPQEDFLTWRFVQYPTVPEEREPLSSHHVTAAALSTALLVDTNLDTSSPDTYRPPPMPMPYETYVGRPRTPPGNQDGIKNEAAVQETSTETGVALNTADAVEAAEKDNKESEGIVQADVQFAASKEVEDELEESEELKKSNILVFLPPQEECPICLEGEKYLLALLLPTPYF